MQGSDECRRKPHPVPILTGTFACLLSVTKHVLQSGIAVPVDGVCYDLSGAPVGKTRQAHILNEFGNIVPDQRTARRTSTLSSVKHSKPYCGISPTSLCAAAGLRKVKRRKIIVSYSEQRANTW